MKTHWKIGTITCALMLTTACAAWGADVREEFHQTCELGKAGQVSLENVNGGVRITAWERNEVRVDAVKRARNREHLEAVKIEVKANGDKIQIKTKYPDDKKNNSTSVEYTLSVPRDSKLNKISTVNGGVQIEGVVGDVEASSVNGQVTGTGLAGVTRLSTINGSVKATVRELRQTVSLSSINGSVTAALPANVNADVSARTQNGGISSEFDLKPKRNFPIGQTLEGKLGSGGPEVKLSTLNGGVHLDRAKPVAAENEG